MRANPCALCADQARELGLQVGDTIQGRETAGIFWHENRITLLWIGIAHTVWIVSGRSSKSRNGVWSAPQETTDWDLACRDWQRIETPPEHAALLPPAPDAGGDPRSHLFGGAGMSDFEWMTPADLIAQAAVRKASEAHDQRVAAEAVARARAEDAAISDAALQAEYRAWWSASYGAPPNAQAVAVAAAWGRHLLSLGLRRLQGEAP